MKPQVLLAAVLVVITLPVASRADTIYSNLGPGSSYAGSAIRAATGSLNLAAATPFVVPSGFDFGLTEIDLAVDSTAAAPALVQLRENAGGAPGTVIDSWTMNFPGLFSNFSIVPSQSITGITGITLDAGLTYWLAVLPASAATDTWWRANNTGQSNIKADSSDGGATFSSVTLNANVAFGVFGTPQAVSTVSEPCALITLSTALGIAGILHRRRFKGQGRLRRGVT